MHNRFFGQQGWALPKRNDFRYTVKQKVLLYDYFMIGETSGKKKSPEEVHLLIREHLETKEYVTTQQIRSLYSRWSKQYREGTLQKPTADNVNDVQDEEDDLAEVYEEDLHQIASEVANPWQIDDWVVVSFQGALYPGVVTKIDEQGTWVDCIEPAIPGKNCYRWPKKKDNIPYKDEEIVCQIDAPVPCSNR